MSDLETFTDTIRKRIRSKTLKARSRAIQALCEELDLSANEQIEGQSELGGKSVCAALAVIKNVGIDRIVEQKTKYAIDKIADRLMEKVCDET